MDGYFFLNTDWTDYTDNLRGNEDDNENENDNEDENWSYIRFEEFERFEGFEGFEELVICILFPWYRLF